MTVPPFLVFLDFLVVGSPRKKLWIDLPPVEGAAGRFRRHQLQPAGAGEAVEQCPRLFGIQALPKGFAANVQQRHIVYPVGPKPAQRPAGIGVLFAQPDLPQRGPAVRPEIVAPQSHRGLDIAPPMACGSAPPSMAQSR